MSTENSEHATMHDGYTACSLNVWDEGVKSSTSLATVDCDECLRVLVGTAYGDDMFAINAEAVRHYLNVLEYGEDAMKPVAP